MLDGGIVQTLLYNVLYNSHHHPGVFMDCWSTCHGLADLMSSNINGLVHLVSFFDHEFLAQHEQFQCSVSFRKCNVAFAPS